MSAPDFRSVGFTDYARHFPRDEAGLVLLAAFNNVRPDQLTEAMKFYPNESTQMAWQRVAEAADELFTARCDQDLRDLFDALDGMLQWHARRCVESEMPLAPEHQEEEVGRAMQVLTKVRPRVATPEGCRAMAVDCGRLADELRKNGQIKAAREQIERARELTLQALRLERALSLPTTTGKEAIA